MLKAGVVLKDQNLLEIDNNRLLSIENRGGVNKERVEGPEIACREIAAPHHGELVDLDDLRLVGGSIDADPGWALCPHFSRLRSGA
ncbi:uncharacterized protein A4U43_C10F5120 [Asparagus officinalis]|uniref:Uncharacterized protein n=1 Tax=Asparagus officinalis TaxID=4686 RepID=A0A5P1E592_ASPOF|nr:uncharacterized protein A4U43_C10F5120 [Asparagus officinalis]